MVVTVTKAADVAKLKLTDNVVVFLDGDDGDPETYLKLEAQYNEIDAAIGKHFAALLAAKEEKVAKYTKSQLNKMLEADVVKIAIALGLKASVADKKADTIKAVLAAQEKAAQ